jgi:hypothetical protein
MVTPTALHWHWQWHAYCIVLYCFVLVIDGDDGDHGRALVMVTEMDELGGLVASTRSSDKRS